MMPDWLHSHSGMAEESGVITMIGELKAYDLSATLWP